MTYKEIIKRIEKENLLIKEIFYTKKNIYECVNNSDVRVFNITKSQYNKISKTYNSIVVREDFNGFTKRYYKIKF